MIRRNHWWAICLILLVSAQGFAQTPKERFAQLTANPLEAPILEVLFLDVGQGDAILVSTPAGENILIDGGPKGSHKVIMKALKAKGITKLDALVITHSHFDHTGGLLPLLKLIPIDTIFYSGQVHPTPSNEKLFGAIKAKKIPMVKVQPGFEFPFKLPSKAVALHPPADWTLDDGTDINDTSIVIRLSFGEIDFLLTGDAEIMSESQILSSKLEVEAEVIKLGHHGSHTASSPRFVERVNPVVAVILCGEGNRYGHPHQQVLDMVRDRGLVLYRSDKNGTVRIRTDGKGLHIDTGDDAYQGRDFRTPRWNREAMSMLQATAM